MGYENEASTDNLQNHGHSVPVVSFYSVQGGVGKSTLAREFAELITVAPGRNGHKPNVLLVDLDVDTNGLTIRLTQGASMGVKTVHEIIAEQNPSFAQALDVTMAVQLASGNPKDRGKLYLMPAAPPNAKGLFDTCANTERDLIFKLLRDMMQALVMQYDIALVVIDCPPGVDPYSACAAALADVPLLIGRNEQATYDGIRNLPERFREMYPKFQPAKQRVIINAVTVKELYEKRAEQFGILDYVPMVSDVIHETEGLNRIESYRTLLFEKYVCDIIRLVLIGVNHLIPEAPSVLGQEWVEAIGRLGRIEEAPKARKLKFFGYLRWVGTASLVLGVAVFGANTLWDSLPNTFRTIRSGLLIVGLLSLICGLYAASARNRLVLAAKDLVIGGPDQVFEMLKNGVAARRQLDKMKKLAESIPKK